MVSTPTTDHKAPKLFKVMACEIAVREICQAVAHSPNMVDLEFVEQGFHDRPQAGHVEIQKRIDAVPAGKYDAILLGYGLCSNMVVGITPTHTPLVIPRAHDCITFFLGSKERYQKVFNAQPGTYYYTTGWLECRHRRKCNSLHQGVTMDAQTDYENWVKLYGEEEAKYLQEVMKDWQKNYTRGALIDFPFTKDLNLASEVKEICDDHGWKFEKMDGDLNLIQRWLDGQWDEEDFLVVQPNQQVVSTCDERVMTVKPAEPKP